MPKIITFVPPEDLSHTRAILNALKECMGVGEYVLFVRVNPGNCNLVKQLKRIRFTEVKIEVASQKFSTERNIQIAWRKAFAQTSFIIHLVPDMLPRRDCLRYMEYCNHTYRDDQEIFSVAAYNPQQSEIDQPQSVFRRSAFTHGITGIWKEKWELLKRQGANESDDYKRLFRDIFLQKKMKEIYPLLSRSCKMSSQSDQQSKIKTSFALENKGFKFVEYRDFIPLVTAVMITGMHKARYPLARVAMECFKKQTYPNKELLIINHGEESLFDGDDRVRELRVKKRESATVGDLRNLGLIHASGQYIVNWDDDDWYHPERILCQMSAQEGDAVVLLKNRIAYSFENGCALYLSIPTGSDATILHPRNMNYRYPSLLRKSDSVFSACFPKRIAMDNDPALFFRFYHGLNLWNADHIMLHLADSKIKNKLEISAEHQRLLKKVLSQYPSEKISYSLSNRRFQKNVRS